MSCPLSWLANNSTELPGLCHFQGSPQQLAIAYLDLWKKCQHGISGLGAEQGLLMGGIDHRNAEDWDVPVFGHQPWERPHFYSHADTLETRDEIHPTLLTLKYRWIKKRKFSLPIYCIYREKMREDFPCNLCCGSDGSSHCDKTCFTPQGVQLAKNFSAPLCEDSAHQTTTSPTRAHGSTFVKHPPAVSVTPRILEQHRTCSRCRHVNWSCGFGAKLQPWTALTSWWEKQWATLHVNRHLICILFMCVCVCVNVCPCVSPSCPSRWAGLRSGTATPVSVSSPELRLLAVLLPAYSGPSSPGKMRRLHHPSWLQTAVHGPGHEVFRRPGWLHVACGANAAWTLRVHRTTEASGRTAVPPSPLL